MIGKRVEYNYCIGHENNGLFELRTGIVMDKFSKVRYESHYGKTEMATDEMYLIKRDSGECDSIGCSSITKILE